MSLRRLCHPPTPIWATIRCPSQWQPPAQVSPLPLGPSPSFDRALQLHGPMGCLRWPSTLLLLSLNLPAGKTSCSSATGGTYSVPTMTSTHTNNSSLGPLGECPLMFGTCCLHSMSTSTKKGIALTSSSKATDEAILGSGNVLKGESGMETLSSLRSMTLGWLGDDPMDRSGYGEWASSPSPRDANT